MHAYLVPGITSEWSERLSTPCVGCGAPGVARAMWPERSICMRAGGDCKGHLSPISCTTAFFQVPSAKLEKPSHNNGF
jgi:hypothetical protein